MQLIDASARSGEVQSILDSDQYHGFGCGITAYLEFIAELLLDAKLT